MVSCKLKVSGGLLDGFEASVSPNGLPPPGKLDNWFVESDWALYHYAGKSLSVGAGRYVMKYVLLDVYRYGTTDPHTRITTNEVLTQS